MYPRAFLQVAVTAISIALSASMAAASDARALVDADWLDQHFRSPGIVVLDVRGDRRSYIAGHVPGAVYTDYNEEWRRTVKGIPDLLPTVEKLADVIGKLGIGNADHVIVVGAGIESADMAIAARIYWTLKSIGHGKVSILDGGMRAYSDRQFETVKPPSKPAPKKFMAKFRNDWLATAEDVRNAKDNHRTLIDARAKSGFSGLIRATEVIRAGTIPDAVNVPAAAVLRPRLGIFEAAPTLEAAFAAAGVERTAPAIVFDDTALLASLTWFGLSEILGRPDIRLYDGSLAAWSRSPGNPVIVPK